MSDFREECIEAGRDAMGRSDSWRWWAPRHLYRLFDLWEPMIREKISAEIQSGCSHYRQDNLNMACPQCRHAARIVRGEK